MSRKILVSDFNKLCRTCSQTTSLVSIPENIHLIETIAVSTQIQIQLNDELPKNICLNCVKELNRMYAFINKCRANDAEFRHCLTEQKLLNDRENNFQIKTEPLEIVNIVGDGSSHSSAIKSAGINQQQEFEDGSSGETNEVCTHCNKSFAENAEFISHLNDCQFMKLLEQPMELNESSDDAECQDDPLDVSSICIPERSRTRYERTRTLFLAYCKQHNHKKITENVVLKYFLEKSKTTKPSSLWSSYSMLKTTLYLEDDVDISKYRKLTLFLRRKKVGYKAKVSKIFTKEQVNKFLLEAPDDTYLMMKVAMIMGIAGGCQRDELMRMSIDDIEDKDSVLFVTVPVPNKNCARTFFITQNEADWLNIYRKYYSYRESLNTGHKRLFINYNNDRFSNLPAGQTHFTRFPKLIAKYLNLPNPALYNAHCFRQTSALVFNRRGMWNMPVDMLSIV